MALATELQSHLAWDTLSNQYRDLAEITTCQKCNLSTLIVGISGRLTSTVNDFRS